MGSVHKTKEAFCNDAIR